MKTYKEKIENLDVAKKVNPWLMFFAIVLLALLGVSWLIGLVFRIFSSGTQPIHNENVGRLMKERGMDPREDYLELNYQNQGATIYCSPDILPYVIRDGDTKPASFSEDEMAEQNDYCEDQADMILHPHKRLVALINNSLLEEKNKLINDVNSTPEIDADVEYAPFYDAKRNLSSINYGQIVCDAVPRDVEYCNDMAMKVLQHLGYLSK